MSKIEGWLVRYAKKIEGNVLALGNFDKNFIDTLRENKKVVGFDLLGEVQGESGKGKGRKKRIPFKKIYKRYKKKKIDYIVSSYDDLMGYKRRFIIDSVALSTNTIVVLKNEAHLELVKNRFSRYPVVIEEHIEKNGYILIISHEEKSIKHKRIYLLKDTIIDGLEMFGDLFIS